MKIGRFCLLLSLIVIMLGSCTKNTSPAIYPISGLWIGTYSFKTQPPLYFSFSIYPDGSLSYKAAMIDGSFVYANGTWMLNNNKFTYHVITTDIASDQTGTADFSNMGKLANGINTNTQTGESGSFTMSRSN
jgi:hypothetical protein